MPEVYEPREDSFLIMHQIRKFAKGNVLDMGTGSGILAIEAARYADRVIAADINKEALEYAKEQARARGVINTKFVLSDLFSYFEQHPVKFDLIIFNPPYLPEDVNEADDIKLCTTGGKKGYEILDRFFSSASKYLNASGKILFVFSSLTNKEKVHSIVSDYGFEYRNLAEESMFAETIYVYAAEKSQFLIDLELNSITDVAKLTEGHRGIIFTGILDGKKVVIKQKREGSEAIGRIENEARWLKILNKKGIGPMLIYIEKDYFVYEFIKGETIIPYLEKASKTNIKKVIENVLKQCYVLDEMGVNKEEMHNPYKHIIVRGNIPVMIDARKSKISGISKTPEVVLIDFERNHVNIHPKNVTQFCQFITSTKIMKILDEKGFSFKKKDIISGAKDYKKAVSEVNLRKIVERVR